MKTIKINNEVYVAETDHKKALTEVHKKKGVIVEGKACPFVIGGKYFFRTVTYFATGEVVAIHGDFLELGDAAWIADTGRFREAIMQGILNEVEPVEVPMFINLNTITDAFEWLHGLPREQK